MHHIATLVWISVSRWTSSLKTICLWEVGITDVWVKNKISCTHGHTVVMATKQAYQLLFTFLKF